MGNIKTVHAGQRSVAAHDALQFFRRFLVGQLLHLTLAFFFLYQFFRIVTGQLHQFGLVTPAGRCHGNLAFRFFRKPLLQQGKIPVSRQAGYQDFFRQEDVFRIIILFQKCRNDIRFLFLLSRQHKIFATDKLAAPDKEHLQANVEVILGIPHHIHVAAFQHGLLAFLQPVHRLQLVTVAGCLFKFIIIRRLLHGLFQVPSQFLRLPVQHQANGFDQFTVCVPADFSRTGSQTAFDMILQAGPLLIHVAAVPYGKQGTQQFHGGAQCPYIRIGTVIFPAVFYHATGDVHAGELFLQGDLQIGIGFIVPQHDVVTGTVFLDQVAFQNQSFDLAVGHDGFKVFHMADQRFHFDRMSARCPEVAVDPVIQIFCLAYVDNPAGAVVHEVHAGLMGQNGKGFFDFITDNH